MAKRPRKISVPISSVRTDIVIYDQPMEAAYRVPDLQPVTEGKWRSEHDKVAWTDRTTGYPCIIRREEGGYLAGFVGVAAGHPLFGWSADALPPGLMNVHSGLDYAEPCDESGPEDRSVCHVGNRARRHDDRWWLGFSCNQIADLVPDDSAHALEAQRLGIEQTYRAAEYVFGQCTDLAAQLKAVEHEGER